MFNHKHIDFFVGIAIIGAVLFLILAQRDLDNRLEAQELKANALIEEVGETKEKSNELFQKLVQEQVYGPETQANKPQQHKVPRPRTLTTQNILIVGEHSKLADTIMLAFVRQQEQKINLLSIPRDLFLEGRKINEYMSLYGIEVLKDKLEKTLNITIHKYVVFDFDAFEKLIDTMGGIDLYVPKAIQDWAYPAGKGKYIVYSIAAGSHHLNGEEALKYARSRHSTSDFDRAKRQQEIIKAVYERVLNFNFLSHLDDLKKVYDSLGLQTDISILEVAAYIEDFQHASLESGNVLSTQNYLYSTMSAGGQYILLPKEENFNAVRDYVQGLAR